MYLRVVRVASSPIFHALASSVGFFFGHARSITSFCLPFHRRFPSLNRPASLASWWRTRQSTERPTWTSCAICTIRYSRGWVDRGVCLDEL